MISCRSRSSCALRQIVCSQYRISGHPFNLLQNAYLAVLCNLEAASPQASTQPKCDLSISRYAYWIHDFPANVPRSTSVLITTS